MNNKIAKLIVVFYAVLIGLGFYSLVNWLSFGLSLGRIMGVVGLVVVAIFVERRYSYNAGIRLFLEIARDVLGGLGSISFIYLLPMSVSEEMSVVIMLAATAILGVTMDDSFFIVEEEEEKEQ